MVLSVTIITRTISVNSMAVCAICIATSRQIWNQLDDEHCIVFRTRIKVNGRGELVSVHYGRIAGTDYRYTSTETMQMVSVGSVTNNPVFNRGYEPMLRPNATHDEVMYALAKYISVVPSSIGGGFVFSDVIDGNFDLDDLKYRNGWCRPTTNGQCPWKHSDMKDSAYFYIHKLYDEIVQKGALK